MFLSGQTKSGIAPAFEKQFERRFQKEFRLGSEKVLQSVRELFPAAESKARVKQIMAGPSFFDVVRGIFHGVRPDSANDAKARNRLGRKKSISSLLNNYHKIIPIRQEITVFSMETRCLFLYPIRIEGLLGSAR